MELFADILWRPYWQMYGELFLDDLSEGMGENKKHHYITISANLKLFYNDRPI